MRLAGSRAIRSCPANLMIAAWFKLLRPPTSALGQSVGAGSGGAASSGRAGATVGRSRRRRCHGRSPVAWRCRPRAAVPGLLPAADPARRLVRWDRLRRPGPASAGSVGRRCCGVGGGQIDLGVGVGCRLRDLLGRLDHRDGLLRRRRGSVGGGRLGQQAGRCLPLDAGRLGQRPAAELGQPGGDERQVLPPLRLGDRRQDRVPQRQERAAQLEPAVRPGEEPHVQVRRAVAPPVHVHPGHAVERPDGPLQPYRHHAEFGGEQVGQVTQVEVGPGLQDQHHRQPGRAGPWRAPATARPPRCTRRRERCRPCIPGGPRPCGAVRPGPDRRAA